jgi:hypothetical protein
VCSWSVLREIRKFGPVTSKQLAVTCRITFKIKINAQLTLLSAARVSKDQETGMVCRRLQTYAVENGKLHINFDATFTGRYEDD